MKLIVCILALLLAMSTATFSQDRVDLLYSSKSYQIYYVVEDHYNMVHFEGSMDTLSSFMIFTALEFTKSKYLSVNSDGGYIEEAYQLGKLLKSVPDVTFMVINDNICLSACAFAALSANKVMIGKNGLEFHMPYVPYVSTSDTLEEYSKNSRKSLLDLIQYFNMTGYGDDFLNLMIDKTSKKEFLVFYKMEDLEYFKVDNFFDQTLPDSNNSKYIIKTR